jgi:ABC-type taurine transport system substrate-binding protein
MVFTVTFAQFLLIKAAMGAQVVVIYQKDSANPLKVASVSLLDPKLGGASFDWTDAAAQPLVVDFLAQAAGAIEVASITG